MSRAAMKQETEYDFKQYLIEHYPVGRNYLEPLTGEYGQLHESTRHSGGSYVHVDGFGNPAMKVSFLDSLNGLPNHVVRQAIDEVRSWTCHEPSGEVMIEVLEYFQDQEMHQGRGRTVQWLAQKLSTSDRNLYYWLDKVCRFVERQSWRIYKRS